MPSPFSRSLLAQAPSACLVHRHPGSLSGSKMIFICMYVCMYVCVYVCMYAYVCMCMYVCMYVCMYIVCTVYMCMYVCMYVPEGIITACHLTFTGPKGQMSGQNLVCSDILANEIIRTRLNVW